MKRRDTILAALAILVLVSVACTCGGSGTLTAHGGGCGDVYCFSVYGEGIGTSRNEAYQQAVNQLNSALRRNDRCGGSGVRTIKERTANGSYFIKVAVDNTTECSTATTDTEEIRAERANILLKGLICILLFVVVWIVLGIFVYPGDFYTPAGGPFG